MDVVHAALVRVHAKALAASGSLERVRALRPSMATLSIWDRMAQGFGAGIHDWMRDDSPDAACSSFTECQAVMPARVLQPLGKAHDVYLVNEAFGSRVGWCEGSLVMAENVVHSHFGLSRPEWLDAKTYARWVIYNTSTLHQYKLSMAKP